MIEVVNEEVERKTKIFIDVDDRKTWEQIYDALISLPNVWTEDPWSPDEEEGVLVVELTKQLLIYFVLKT